jgi:hypothetical protein
MVRIQDTVFCTASLQHLQAAILDTLMALVDMKETLDF